MSRTYTKSHRALTVGIIATMFLCLICTLFTRVAFASEESRWDELLKISDIKQIEVTESNRDEIVKLEKKKIELK